MHPLKYVFIQDLCLSHLILSLVDSSGEYIKTYELVNNVVIVIYKH